MNTLTQSRLKELLHYNPNTGIFTWLKKRRYWIVGRKAGHLNVFGYISIRVDGKLYQAHRLAILYTDGYFPETGVDHIDRNKQNNKRANLREAGKQCNARNSGVCNRNTSGITGGLLDS